MKDSIGLGVVVIGGIALVLAVVALGSLGSWLMSLTPFGLILTVGVWGCVILVGWFWGMWARKYWIGFQAAVRKERFSFAARNLIVMIFLPLMLTMGFVERSPGIFHMPFGLLLWDRETTTDVFAYERLKREGKDEEADKHVEGWATGRLMSTALGLTALLGAGYWGSRRKRAQLETFAEEMEDRWIKGQIGYWTPEWREKKLANATADELKAFARYEDEITEKWFRVKDRTFEKEAWMGVIVLGESWFSSAQKELRQVLRREAEDEYQMLALIKERRHAS